jgi:hypothetical protein
VYLQAFGDGWIKLESFILLAALYFLLQPTASLIYFSSWVVLEKYFGFFRNIKEKHIYI